MAGPSDPAAASAPTKLAELSGTTLEGRYELGKVLGTGGMGAVFEAKHLLLGRRVAIKVLRPDFFGQDEYIKRFLREARAASKIRHRNVVEILDYGETAEGFVYSVMELLQGKDLHRILRDQAGGRLPWAHACPLLVQIASGLRAAHACGVIHRDIKPANCFVTEEDGEPVVKVVDFGLAKLEDVEQDPLFTRTNQLMGTPSYIAPELVRTKSPASPRSDIYSLGVLAYRVLTGRVPFVGDTMFEVLRRSCFEPVPSLCEQVPGLPPAVEALVHRMLAKEPEDRPEDMQAVRDALLAIGQDTLGARSVDIPPSSALPLELSNLVSELASELDEHAAVSMLTTVPGRVEPRTPSGPVHPSEATITVVSSPAAFVSFPPTAVVSSPAAAGVSAPAAAGVSAPAAAVVSAPAAAVVSPPPAMPAPAVPLRRASTEVAPARVGAPAGYVAGRAAAPATKGGGRKGAWIVIGGAVGAGALAALVALGTAEREAEPVTAASGAAAPVEPPRASPQADAGAPVAAPAPSVDAAAPVGSAPSQAEPAAMATAAMPSGAKVEAAPAPAVEPAPASATEPAPKTNPVSSGPPSDAVLAKRLARKIKSKCAELLGGGAVKVSIIVESSGKIFRVTATPSDAAGRCATAQVEGTVFRSRPEDGSVVFTVS